MIKEYEKLELTNINNNPFLTLNNQNINSDVEKKKTKIFFNNEIINMACEITNNKNETTTGIISKYDDYEIEYKYLYLEDLEFKIGINHYPIYLIKNIEIIKDKKISLTNSIKHQIDYKSHIIGEVTKIRSIDKPIRNIVIEAKIIDKRIYKINNIAFIILKLKDNTDTIRALSIKFCNDDYSEFLDYISYDSNYHFKGFINYEETTNQCIMVIQSIERV